MNARKYMSTLLAGAFAATISAPSLAESPEEYAQVGRTAFSMGKFDDAVHGYSQAIQLDPNNASFYVMRGDARKNQNDYAGAMEDYTQAIRIDPQLRDGYSRRAEVRQILGDSDGSARDFEMAKGLEATQSANPQRTDQQQMAPVLPALKAVGPPVVASHIDLVSGSLGFSIENHLAQPIGAVRYVIAIFDSDNQPVDSEEGTLGGQILPGLAKRVHLFGARFRLDKHVSVKIVDYVPTGPLPPRPKPKEHPYY